MTHLPSDKEYSDLGSSNNCIFTDLRHSKNSTRTGRSSRSVSTSSATHMARRTSTSSTSRNSYSSAAHKPRKPSVDHKITGSMEGFEFFGKTWQSARVGDDIGSGSASDSGMSEHSPTDVMCEEIGVAILHMSEGQKGQNQDTAKILRISHSIVLVGLAAMDALHYAGKPELSATSLLCLVLPPYMLATTWAMLLFRCGAPQSFSHRLSAIILTLLQVTATLLSFCWRRDFDLRMADLSGLRAAYLLALLQVLSAACQPIDSIDSLMACLISVTSLIVFRCIQEASLWNVVEDSMLITCSGLSCIMMGMRRGSETPPEIDYDGLMEIFAPFMNPYHKQRHSKMRTNLDRLTAMISTTCENVKSYHLQTEWLQVLASVLKAIHQELKQVGSLMRIDECDLTGETPELREYVKRTFKPASEAASSDIFSFGEDMRGCAEAIGEGCERNGKSVDDSIKHMLDVLTFQDSDHADGMPLPPAALPGLDMVLSLGLGRWNFDMFKFSTLCHGRPLVTSGTEVMRIFGEKLHVDTLMITAFLDSIEGRYRASNPYHNSLHASDVLNSMSYMLRLRRCPSMVNLPVIERFSGLVACVGHDVGHPGQSNRYHTSKLTPLALLFNDQAPLENMHCAITFAVLQAQECNFFIQLDASARVIFRGIVVQMILETDLARHVQTVSRFRQEMLSDATMDRSALNSNQRKELLIFILKSADVGGSSKVFELHLQWTLRINSEFFDQGDAEKNLGIACSPFCDRAKTKVAESQRGFFKFIVMPLYTAIDEYLSDSRMKFEVLHEQQVNYTFWEKYQDEDFDYADPMLNVQMLRQQFRKMNEIEEKDGRPSGFMTTTGTGSRSTTVRSARNYASPRVSVSSDSAPFIDCASLMQSPSLVKRRNSDPNLCIGKQEDA